MPSAPYSSLIFVPLIGAFIGWVTNYIAVRMLFHPRRELRFLGLRIQGVFPKRQAAFAEKLGQMVADELVSIADITSEISAVTQSPQVYALVEARIDQAIKEKLPKAIPMASILVGEKVMTRIKGQVMEEVQEAIRSVSDLVQSDLTARFDIRVLVEDRVKNFSSDKLEEIILSIMRRELRFVELVGGVLGFLIGVVQAGIVLIS